MRLSSVVAAAVVLGGLALSSSAQADTAPFTCVAKLRATNAVVGTFQGDPYNFNAQIITLQVSPTLLFSASQTPITSNNSGASPFVFALSIDDLTAKDHVRSESVRTRELSYQPTVSVEAISSKYTLACFYHIID